MEKKSHSNLPKASARPAKAVRQYMSRYKVPMAVAVAAVQADNQRKASKTNVFVKAGQQAVRSA